MSAMDYKINAQKASKDKGVAELKMQASMLSHSAACMAGDSEAEVKTRQEIHALQDIILDANAMIYYCLNKLSEQ